MDSSTTIDGLLNRRVMLEQPEVGYRVAVDTVLLAAAVPAFAGDRVLDMGAGVGGAILCLAARVPGVTGAGLEMQQELVDLFVKNITRNAFAKGLEARQGDVAHLPPEYLGTFDHVMMNPPYHEEKRHDASDNDIKRIAHIEKPGDLEAWIGAAAKALKPAGSLTIIHRADRQKNIVALLELAFGAVEIVQLLPREGVAAKRVVVRALKNDLPSVDEMQPLILHKEEGGYTAETDEILRNAQPMPFNPA
jgi:tRNA1(Val) A37 N6-methylase TrmN6